MAINKHIFTSGAITRLQFNTILVIHKLFTNLVITGQQIAQTVYFIDSGEVSDYLFPDGKFTSTIEWTGSKKFGI